MHTNKCSVNHHSPSIVSDEAEGRAVSMSQIESWCLVWNFSCLINWFWVNNEYDKWHFSGKTHLEKERTTSNPLTKVVKEAMFLCREAFLICKAHVNTWSVTFHFSKRNHHKKWLLLHLLEPLLLHYGFDLWKWDRLQISVMAWQRYYLIPTHPHTVKRIRPTHFKHKWIHKNLELWKFANVLWKMEDSVKF